MYEKRYHWTVVHLIELGARMIIISNFQKLKAFLNLEAG